MKIERKTLLLELKAEEEGAFIVRIATLNVRDKDGDVTLPGAFEDGKTVLVSAYMHSSWEGRLPVGKAVIREDGEEVIAEGQFNLKTSEGRDTYEAVKFSGELQEWSYGFYTLEAEEGMQDDEVVRFLKKLDVKEISPVLVGAGENTATLAIKADGLPYAEQAEAVLAAVDELATRTRLLADLRRKEGRDISETHRSNIGKLLKTLGEIAERLQTIINEPGEKDQAAEINQLFLRFSRTKTKISEVLQP